MNPELYTAALLAEQAYGAKHKRPQKTQSARVVIQLAPDWELYLDSIDRGHKCRWTDNKSRAWSWHSADHPEPIARLARIREKYPQALIVPR